MKQLCVGIHCHEQPELLHETLESVRRNTASTVNLILLPDGPDTRMKQALQGLDQIPQSGTAEASGTAACFNRLADSTRADIVVLLESGAQVGPSWLDRLLAALDSDPHNGLAGPSTNHAWNEQCAFRGTPNEPGAVARTAQEAARRFGQTWRTLEPLHSLSDFCYAVKREVIEAIGPADESYGLGPCWEMDYNIRAARAGWRGAWVCGAYVHRAPFTERRQREEARLFEANKHHYQDKFCGAHLRGEKTDYRTHCRGDSCPNFAPTRLLIEGGVIPSTPPAAQEPQATPARVSVEAVTMGLASCIMPTCDRLEFVPRAIENFLRQDYRNRELVVVDDGSQSVEGLLPPDPRIRLIRLPKKECVGAKRNIACQAARGDVILHWDDDDWYPSDRVRLQMEPLSEGGFAVCGTSVLYYHEPATGRVWRYRYVGARAWVAGNTLAYRKAWWAAHPFPEIQVGEDSRFVWTVPSERVFDLRRPGLCIATIHKGNTSRKAPRGSYWESCHSREIESLLGSEWATFAQTGEPPPPSPSYPLVSCIMPTCNRRAFVPLALNGFLAQDYPNKELVVVEDGESDVSEMVCGLDAVRYVRLPQRSSIGNKRNLACEMALGTIIAHWDDDDWYGVHRLSHQVAPLLAGRADLTGLENAFQVELASGAFVRTKPELHRRMFVGDLHGGTLVYWKTLFDEGMRYPDVNLAEDAAFVRGAQLRGKRILRLNNPGLFVYVRHGRNSWRVQSPRMSDRLGWERVACPEAFSEQLLGAFRNASET